MASACKGKKRFHGAFNKRSDAERKAKQRGGYVKTGFVGRPARFAYIVYTVCK
jgi:hypothetical protein